MNIESKYNFFYYAFWFWTIIAIIGVFLLIQNFNTIQNASLSFSVMAYGMSMSFVCFTMVNNQKNEIQFNKFKKEIQTQLDRIEENINK